MKKISVAVIDDYSPLREKICFLLADMGIEILFQATDGREGFELLEAGTSLPDICMLDINMPVMDGFTTTEKIKQKFPSVKILVHTVHTDEESMVKMFCSGADGYILKGAEPEELQKAIESLQQCGCYLSAEVIPVLIAYFRSM